MMRVYRLICVLVTVLLSGACSSAGSAAGSLKEPVQLTFDNTLNLIILEASIRGQGPFRFTLDTGSGGTVIDAGLAERLGLQAGNAATGRGTVAGSQVTSAPVQGGVDFTFAPGFVYHEDLVIAAPFTQMGRVMIGEHFDGVLGSSIFFSHVVEVDYVQRTITFHDPAWYQYQGTGTELALDFPRGHSKQAYAKMTLVNGQRRLDDFAISVDSGGNLVGTTRVGNRAQWDSLMLPSNRLVEVMGATGLSNDPEGNRHENLVAQVDRLILGPFEFEGPDVAYSSSGPSFGSFGATLLHRFTTIYDYSRKRLILEPNSNYGKPLIMDKSGLMLVLSDPSEAQGDVAAEAFKVLFVSPATPGHKAGLVRHDLIRSIDGVPSAQISLTEARFMFCKSADYRLVVQRDGQIHEVLLKTRSLF